MKTNGYLVIAMIFLSVFVANAFAVFRPTYPTKPHPPDHIIIIGDEQNDWIWSANRRSR